MNFDHVPRLLKDKPNWIVWKKEKRNGEDTKIPYNAATGQEAKSNDPVTWTNFKDASETAFSGKYNGVGFQLRGTDLVGFDFDGVMRNGTIDAYVLNILEMLPRMYVEVTPSKTGLRAFVVYDKPLPPGKRKFDAKMKGVKKYGIEIYSGREGGRYLTVTGDHLRGEGVPVVDDLSVPYFLISKFSDERFKKMWLGDPSDFENDDSRLDLALLSYLVRAFDGNTEEALRFFNLSVPGHREKWVKRDDYQERTLMKAATRVAKSDGMESDERQPLDFKKPPVELIPDKSAYEYVLRPPIDSKSFDGWFPLGSPSLIGGSSGSGKTTFMLDLCVAQKTGLDFYGHGTNTRPFLVLMLDRGKLSHERTMRRLRFKEGEVPIRFLSPVYDEDASQEILNRIEEAEITPQLVFVEGMDMLVSDPNKMEIVAPFLREIQTISEHFHCAIVGSTGAPKSKPREGYTAKRDTIFGSAVWGRMVETVVTIQFPDGDDTSDQRIISVLPRNAKAERFDVEFKDGRLVKTVVVEEPEEETKLGRPRDKREHAKAFIQEQLQKGRLRTTASLVKSAKNTEALERDTVVRALDELLSNRVITRTEIGGEEFAWKLAPELQSEM